MPYQTIELTDFQNQTSYIWKFPFDEENVHSLFLADHAAMTVYDRVSHQFQKAFFQGRTDTSIKGQEIERGTRETLDFLYFGVRRINEQGDLLPYQPLPRQEQVANANVCGKLYDYLVSIAGLPQESNTFPIHSFSWP